MPTLSPTTISSPAPGTLYDSSSSSSHSAAAHTFANSINTRCKCSPAFNQPGRHSKGVLDCSRTVLQMRPQQCLVVVVRASSCKLLCTHRAAVASWLAGLAPLMGQGGPHLHRCTVLASH